MPLSPEDVSAGLRDKQHWKSFPTRTFYRQETWMILLSWDWPLTSYRHWQIWNRFLTHCAERFLDPFFVRDHDSFTRSLIHRNLSIGFESWVLQFFSTKPYDCPKRRLPVQSYANWVVYCLISIEILQLVARVIIFSIMSSTPPTSALKTQLRLNSASSLRRLMQHSGSLYDVN